MWQHVKYIRNPSPCRDSQQEVSFSIKRALGSRKGWKIMADDGHSFQGSALKTVVSMIKDMEFQVTLILREFSYLILILYSGICSS